MGCATLVRIMSKPLLAIVVALVALSTFLTPVSAHFTLGDYTSAYPCHANNYDPHVQGVVGYVWPGTGLIGQGTLNRPEAPGYQSPWPNYPPGIAPRPSWRQLEGNAYAPFGAVLTSTDQHSNQGDLLLAINYTQPTQKWAYWYLHIWIPPEFTGIDRTRIVTTLTNVYSRISVGITGKEEPTGPSWIWIRITCDAGHLITFKPDGVDRWYYVRINQVTAPKIAGKYFFKIALSNSSDILIASKDMIPTQNWPILMVKGEVDPAIIWGTIRYGGWNTTLYGFPIKLPGRVRAVGIADDPYTGKTTGRRVEARGHFNHTAQGHHEIEGVAPGTYDLYASSAGYPEQKIASGIKVMKGQSLQIDGYLTPGVAIRGEVFSKCGTGEINWHYDRSPIKIEIYGTKTDAEQCDRYSETRALTWSPWGPAVKQFPWWGLTTGDYSNGNLGIDYDGVGPPQNWIVSSASTSFRFQFGEEGKYGAPSELDGHVPQRNATWINGLSPGPYYAKAYTHGYVQTKPDGVTFEPVAFTTPSIRWPGNVHIPFDIRLSSIVQKTVHFHDQPGTAMEAAVLTSRYLYSEAIDNTNTRVAWRVQLVPAGSLTATVTLHGFLDQTYGYGWGRNYGLKAGTYTIKTYMYGYVSPIIDTVTIGLCGSTLLISNHMHKGVSFNLTIYSKDWEMPRVLKPWVWDGETIYVLIMNQGDKQLDYTTITQNKLTTYAKTGVYSGRNGGTTNYDVGNYPVWFSTGLYRFEVLTYGYVQKREFSVYAKEGNVTADIGVDVVVGANITLTVKFRHENIFEHLIANSSVRVRIFNDKSRLVGEWLTSDPRNPVRAGTEILNYMPSSTVWFSQIIAGLPSVYDPDPYFPFGYNLTMRAPYGIDASPNYRGGWTVEVDIVPWYGDTNFDGSADFFPPMLGILYGESPKYIPANHLGPYELRYTAQIPNTHLSGEASIIITLDRRGLLWGNIYAYTFCDECRTTSWVTMIAKGIAGTFNFYTMDSTYAMWLPTGDYQLTIAEWSPANEGHTTQVHAIRISDGQIGQFDAYLEQSSIPIPEQITPATATMTLLLVTSLLVYKKKRRPRQASSEQS